MKKLFGSILRGIFFLLKIDSENFSKKTALFSLGLIRRQLKNSCLLEKLVKIIPDISFQQSGETVRNSDYIELKRRLFHVFQCQLMLDAFAHIAHKEKYMVVDVGDSAGTHMIYIKELMKDKYLIDTLSINLDAKAIEKIKNRGLPAMLCRAEDLNIDFDVDLFTSFEMLEHLHDPAKFLHLLAKRPDQSRLLLTVPYRKASRVGLHHVRLKTNRPISAEEEHIFELCPDDWTLLMAHAGWKVVFSRIHYQYPRRILLLSQGLSIFWRWFDYEGFWGVFLEKDPTYARRYMDWADDHL
jgi:hypothetical protein